MANFSCIYSAMSDIDELKERISRLESELNTSRQAYSSLIEKTDQNLKDLFDSSNDLIIIFGTTGELRFANKAVKKKLDYTQEEIKTLKFLNLVHEDYQRGALQFILKVTAGSTFEKFDTVLTSHAGKSIYVNGKITGLFENEEPVEYRCVFYDVTERIRAESAQSLYDQIANITIASKGLEKLYANIYAQLNHMLRIKNFQIHIQEKDGFRRLFSVHELEDSHELTFDVDHLLMSYTLHRKSSMIIYEEGIQKILDQHKVEPKDPIPKIWLGVVIATPTEKGVMSICSYKDQGTLNNKDLELLDFIAGQISLAMERQFKEEKIENQAATLSAIFDSSTHEIWSVDRKYHFTSFNQNYERAFEKYYGVRPERGRTSKNIPSTEITGKGFEFWKSKYREAFKGNFVNFQTQNRDRNGKMVWREVFVNPIFLPSGRIEELSIIANDITDKKESESALIASEEKFRSIFESFQDIYFRCNQEGEIIMVSPSVQEALGYPPIEIIGTSMMRYVASKWQIYRMIHRTLQEQRVRNIEATLCASDGRQMAFLFNIRLIQNESGQHEVEGVARDISKLKKTNEELLHAKEMAEHSLEIKDRFLANMSHEIRTPMNGIIGMIDLLAKTGLNTEQSDFIKTLRKSSQTLLNILNDILDLSKIEAGKMDILHEPVDLAKTIEKVCDLFSKQASFTKNQLHYHIDKDTPRWVLADERRLIQVLSNLTSNAIKFSDQEGQIYISLHVVEKNNNHFHFRITVKDAGIGIKESDICMLFQNFHQVDSSRSKNFEGTGLGLAISKELVKNMEGDIGALSTPGLGSTFWFTFRAEKTTAPSDPTHQSQSLPPIDFLSGKPKVLLVDDNEVNRKVASSMLIKSGCKVVEASDGHSAIQKVKNNEFDVVLMDIQMPKMDGIACTQQIKQLELKKMPPFIAMTAYAMEEDQERFLKAGMDDYLAKPIKAELLIQKVKKWVHFETSKNQLVGEVLTEDAAIMNLDTLHQLARFGGQELIEETLRDFDAEAERLIASAHDYFQTSNFEHLSKTMHTLKGIAGTLGIEKLAKQALKVEKYLETNNFGSLNNQLNVLSNLYVEYKDRRQHIVQPAI